MSHPKWPMVPLGELVTKSEERVVVEADQAYPNFGVYNCGRGLFEKTPISGSTSSATSLYRAKANQFVYSRLFAFEGSYGLVPEEFDGYFVSNEFPLFDSDPSKLLPEFLGWYFRTPKTWREVALHTTGMGSRRQRIKPDAFLRCSIQIPEIPEQSRIVDNLNRLGERIEDARKLRCCIARETLALSASLHSKLADGRIISMSKLVELREDRVSVDAETLYPQVGIRGYGGGLFSKQATAGNETSYKYFNRLAENMLVLSQPKGWEGAIAVCGNEHAGWFSSPEYRTFICREDECNPRYLDLVVRSDWFRILLDSATHGQGGRRERTRPERVLTLKLLMPRLKDQEKALSIIERLNEVRSFGQDVDAKTTDMMPSILDRAFKGEL